MSTTLKQLAKRARSRLITAGECSKPDEKTAYLTATTSYMVVASKRNIEDDPIYYKVKKVLEKGYNDIILNPISQIMDNKYYATLSANEKERYILKLSKKYNTIKDYILSNNLLNVTEEQAEN